MSDETKPSTIAYIVGYIGGAALGAYVGWDVTRFANSLGEAKGTLDYLVSEWSLVTTLTSIFTIGNVGGAILGGFVKGIEEDL